MFSDDQTILLQRLMPFKVRKVLLVASLYDAFILEEDGRLIDLLNQAYQEKNLGYVPVIHRTPDAETALEEIKREGFDLVIAMQRVGEINPFAFGSQAKQISPGLPVVILAFQTPELERLLEANDGKSVDKIFLWQGDGKILVGIIQFIEDRRNAAYDTELIGVPNLLVIEDSVQFYSAYLTFLFDELLKLTHGLLKENLSFTERLLRQRGRPRVHLATDYEEGLQIFQKFKSHLLGLITDVSFSRGKEVDNLAGLEFARSAREELPHLPILLQSSELRTRAYASSLNAGFLHKHSPTLIEDFRLLLLEFFGFGDLVFRDHDQHEIARVPNLEVMSSIIESLPPGVIERQFRNGDITRWLWARTELGLAKELSSREIKGDIRREIKEVLDSWRQKRQRGNVVPFSRRVPIETWHFCRIGEGSMGGKARGLAFMDKILASNFSPTTFPEVEVGIPRALILSTEIFEDFLQRNRLLKFALEEKSDIRIAGAFLGAELSPTLVGDLRHFILEERFPLAVRSSSLLEDALYQPFAGIYITKMIPNNEPDADARFLSLTNAIKLVYASTFFHRARTYIESTHHLPEEEKMAVIVQEVVGERHGWRFYPHLSGVARSYNFYPFGHATPEDGVAYIALGLGKTIVEGGVSLRFSPRYPQILPQFNSSASTLKYSQREYYAIDMHPGYSSAFSEEDQYLVKLDLKEAELDGVLDWIASTYNREDERVLDGIAAPGPRILTFAPILKREAFPLSPLLLNLLDTAKQAMGNPVEIEFAISWNDQKSFPVNFGFLQIRPLVVGDELVSMDLTETVKDALIFSDHVLGNGVLPPIHHLIYVKLQSFHPKDNAQIAQEIGLLNDWLKKEGDSSILIGPGRWGSSDPWLGIPVKWNQISQARVIVEVDLPGMHPDPSQGSHFFQNLTSLRIGYFTVSAHNEKSGLDWNWLETQPSLKETDHLRVVKSSEGFIVKMDGRTGRGIVLRSDKSEGAGA